MLDERQYISRVESADADELAQLLERPSRDEEKALRAYLGDARYQRLHRLALKRKSRAVVRPRGNVVVIHGIMGGELGAFSREGRGDRIWITALRLMDGALERLRLGPDGRAEADGAYDVRATGILKRHYGELLLALSQRWNVRAFWFDWRKDLKHAAAELDAQISGWFGDDAPVHIVAHSMGGLVARTFAKRQPERWAALWDADNRGARGGRLIMLGTPNHGSFAIVQAITGLEGVVRKLALLDLRHDRDELLRILNSFVGTYQMLPSPLVVPEIAPLYDAATYGTLEVPQAHLDNAREHHERLSDMVDATRMIYVAGANRRTLSGIKDVANLQSAAAYELTLAGDGRVPHALGLLERDGVPVPTYYVDEVHGDLPTNTEVLASLDDLLEKGETTVLARDAPAPDRAAPAAADGELLEEQRREEEEELRKLVRRVESRRGYPGATTSVSTAEREVEDAVTAGFLSGGDDGGRPGANDTQFPVATVALGVVVGAIEDVADDVGGEPVDAIAVGHYVGVRPQGAELALDRAITAAIMDQGDDAAAPSETDLLLTQYSERGTLRGELAQPFLLDDPRAGGAAARRVIAIAGMGIPGRFGVPELKVLARELCWALGRLGKRHLATVLIGAGNGNLSVEDAVDAWIRGIKNAVTGATEDEGRTLTRVTFVERDPRRIPAIHEAIAAAKARFETDNRMRIDYRPPTDEELAEIRQLALARDIEEREQAWQKPRAAGEDDGRPRAAVRVTVSLDGDASSPGAVYRFGAISETASIPEREIPIDPRLVMKANDELAAERESDLQRQRGRFLEQLLLPEEFRDHLRSDAPIVLLVDSTTARIHWEMLAEPDIGGAPSDAGAAQSWPDETYFLGTRRALTRQLRTTFAPPPEPPPPPRRILRVLVVADPAEDAHLPGAEEEGAEVADLFESFNTTYKQSENRVEVVRLLGPREATRTNVMRELMLRSYDVLHYAGHCVYEPPAGANSGWIFTGDERITANELTRIDRIPKFVFSNACESGITPDRSEERCVELAPSFAESFFGRGVSNFVCTAWPVNDVAARRFACTLYASLLGVPLDGEEKPGWPAPMHAAMTRARHAIVETGEGALTWGAYQHYGNPYFQLFDATTMQASAGAAQ